MADLSETDELMRGLAQFLDGILNDDILPKVTGFVLLTFPLDKPEGMRTNFISNGDRKDMIVAMKEILARFEGQPEVSGRA